MESVKFEFFIVNNDKLTYDKLDIIDVHDDIW